MSISQDSAATIVCREVFDETSHPSNEEVLDYARRLGIDPDVEPHLLGLAREGLMAALPKGWSPCFSEANSAWYYYQVSTGLTTWEHPLDAVYKELVEQARAGGVRQMSVEEDSRTIAKELESHEEASLPKEASIFSRETNSSKDTSNANSGGGAVAVSFKIGGTKIPTKLAPLRKLERLDGTRKKDVNGSDRVLLKRESDSKSETPLSADRASRDYTNLKFQDPRFYECPKLLEDVGGLVSTPKQELDLTEVLKRSESLSPRHEKDWEQLSSKFSSEENMIDIDKLSGSTLARSDRPEKFDKEKHPSQLGQQKELTLSGGGSMFLKSNRSRDATPSQDGNKLEEFRTSTTLNEEIGSVVVDRLKSILREKQTEDDDRPLEEERKSVRFDLEKETDIKFTYSGSEDEWESESEEQNAAGVPMTIVNRPASGSSLTLLRTTSRDFEDLETDGKEEQQQQQQQFEEKEIGNEGKRMSPHPAKLEPLPKSTKIVGKRFVVQNVSENEHRSQMAMSRRTSDGSIDFVSSGKFENIKNIDLISRSETDSSLAKSTTTDSYDVRKTSEKSRKSIFRLGKDRRQSLEDSGAFDVARANQKHLEGNSRYYGKAKLECSRSFEEAKARMSKEHELEIEALRKEFDAKLERTKKELEENFVEQKVALQEDLGERLNELKREMSEKEEEEIEKLIAEMDAARLENLRKVKSELEVCYEKERQEIVENLKAEIEERRRELLEIRSREIGKLEDEHERNLSEEKFAKLNEFELNKQHGEKIEALKKELDKEFDDLRTELRIQQREKITKITEDHEKCLAEILRDFRIDESLARKMYKQRLEEIRADFSRDVEKEARKQTERALQQESIDFEKMRCEMRLLQDKYMKLKEKYMKLKNEVRFAVEKRSKRKEGNATASETERSKTERTESSEQNTPVRNSRSNSIASTKPVDGQSTKQDHHHHQQQQQQQQQGQGQTETKDSKIMTMTSTTTIATPTNNGLSSGFQKFTVTSADAKSAAKFESDDTTTASETNANMMMMKKKMMKKSISRKAANNSGVAGGNAKLNATTGATNAAGNNNNNNLENPVENIRKQLEKLERLGDQLPSNETAYTLRYPFQDKAPANASSELEFFRHRIHVERDSVRRAREALRQQRNVFQGRQRAWKQHSARATLEQLVQEERELSDMEVSLHRTRSLLGEKVIYLRHLEQSLETVANAKRNENDATSTKNDELTLSDMSSASSGFSSTDLGTDTFIDKPDHYQESTEIIASLENLNSEIREIWGVLNKRQDTNIPPPPTLMYSYLRTFGTPNIQSNILSQLTAAQPPTTTTQNIIAQYGPNSGFTTSVGTVERSSSNLVERTRNLRDWLRQARVETTDLVSPGQATL